MGRLAGRRTVSAGALEKVSDGIGRAREMGHEEGGELALGLVDGDSRFGCLGEILQSH